MASKAKSGLSAVRMFPENILVPPNTFTPGSTTFVSSVRDGKGHAAIHVGVTNDTAFVLTILEGWRSSGPLVQARSIASAADPVTGFHVVDVTMPIQRRYVKISLAVPAPGLGANFECGAYFLPRTSAGAAGSSGGGGGSSVVPNRGAFLTGNKSVVSNAAAEQLVAASTPIPDGFSVFLTFKKANAGANVYVAESEAKANAKTNCKITNTQNAGIRLFVNNLNLIWISVDTNLDGVDWIVEQ